MPAGADLWTSDTNYVLKQTDFNTYFTLGQNTIVGTQNGGIIIRLTSSAWSGTNGPRYATLSIYYTQT